MFSGHVFRRFVDHPALTDCSPVIELMNKAHHGRRQEIRPADVAQCADDLSDLLGLVEEMYEECYRWRRRDTLRDQSAAEAPRGLTPMPHPALNVLVCPDLAAFTEQAPSGESARAAGTTRFSRFREHRRLLSPPTQFRVCRAGRIDCHRRGHPRTRGRSATSRRPAWWCHVCAPPRAQPKRDHHRPYRGNPRSPVKNPEDFFLSESEVAIHQVVGIIFDHSVRVPQGQDEAVLVDADDVLKRIEIAFRLTDESAVPLALPKQVVLGSARIRTR